MKMKLKNLMTWSKVLQELTYLKNIAKNSKTEKEQRTYKLLEKKQSKKKMRNKKKWMLKN